MKPPRYFASCPAETRQTPIRYLLTESTEEPVARPVPHNSQLMRSLTRGRGTLRQNSWGLTYLDVNHSFMGAMVPYVKSRAPSQITLSLGSHIPVISKRESDLHYLTQIKDLGREFTFEIEGLYSMRPETWPEVEEVWFFKIRSEDLRKLREKYFLLGLPNGHSFHLAIAIRPGEPLSRPLPFMRINPGFLAA